MSEEGFREIQLNGKQLVFLFMAATVVLVVSFLCGVLVGRGVRVVPAVITEDISPDPRSALSAEPPPPPPVATPGTAGETPPTADNELSYAERLLRENPPEEKLKAAPPEPEESAPSTVPIVKEPVAAAPAPARQAQPPPVAEVPPAAPPTAKSPTPAPVAAAAAPVPVPAKPVVPAPAKPTTPTPESAVAALDPSGPGFAVQVAISKNRQEADTMAKDLKAKGYPAFVMDPAKGAPAGIYRVRIGKYKTRKDAETVAARLKTVERFDPWIAR